MIIEPSNLQLANAAHYHYNGFPPRNLNLANFIEPLITATDALARYDQMLKGLHNSEILLAPLRNQEAVISSRMEGTVSTIDEILRYEADIASDPSGHQDSKTRSEVVETLLYQRALKAVHSAMQEGYPLSKALLRSTHQQLLSRGRGTLKNPGQFKREQNYLGNLATQSITFVPIAPEQLEGGLDRMFDYGKSANTLPLVKTAVTHLEFEALHPFEDGNGRLGRMLITLMLWNEKLISAPHFYISGYFEQHKDEYIETLRRVSSHGEWEQWCHFFLRAVTAQAKENLRVAEAIKELYDSLKGPIGEILSSKYSMIALDFLFTYPVFRNNRLTSHPEIPTGTAARFAPALCEKGLLTLLEPAAGRRPALYSFEPMMKLVRV